MDTPLMRPRRSEPKEHGFPERLALFTCGLTKDRALELLEGLSPAPRERALVHARQVMSWQSPIRQGKVVLEFGVRPDADEKLRALMAQAGPVLQREMYRLLPPYHRTLFPGFTLPPCSLVPPALVAFAGRLVREATRY